MTHVGQDTDQAPQTHERASTRWEWFVETEEAHDGIVHPIEYTEAGSKVVELFGDREVTRMEDGTEEPGSQTYIANSEIVRPKTIVGRDVALKSLETMPMCIHVAKTENHTHRFLDAKKTVERPLAMELDNWMSLSQSSFRHNMLAGVVTF